MIYQTLLIFIGIAIGVVTATVLFWSFKYKDVQDEEGNKPGFLRRGIIGRQQEKKKHNIEKIKEYLKGNSEITNDEVEKLLGVSHTTAWRYLEALEKDGILEQKGKEGRSVRYSITKK